LPGEIVLSPDNLDGQFISPRMFKKNMADSYRRTTQVLHEQGKCLLVHVGGPVQPQAIVVLGDFLDPGEAAALVLGSIGFLPGEIESASEVGSLARARVFAGYAGWGPGQLEGEIAEESWILEQALPEDVFTDEPDHLWSAVLRRKGGAFAVLALMPPDPTQN